MIIDSHCHPQMVQYDKDREEMLRRAKDAGVFMICVGTDYETSKQGIELAQKHENMWATVGSHPNDILDNFEVMICHNLLQNPKVVAVGEVGLDYYRTPEPEKQKKQKEIFEQFANLAIKYDKPLIIHCRDSAKGTTGHAHQDMINIISNLCSNHDRGMSTNSSFSHSSFSSFSSPGPVLRGVMHSFTGTIENARKYLDLGFYIGFNGIITFACQYDEVVKYIPLENILLETDAPFLTPEPYRGKRNEPIYVLEVAKKIAELKNESLEKVIEQTTKNCRHLFSI